MPIYEFICKKCQKIFEKFVFSSTDSKKVDCPHCGAKDVEKQMSSFSSNCGCGSSSENFSGFGNSCGTKRFG